MNCLVVIFHLLDKLNVQLFYEGEFHLVVRGNWLIPKLLAKILLQVFRLEAVAMTRHDLVAHDTERLLVILTERLGVKQHLTGETETTILTGSLIECDINTIILLLSGIAEPTVIPVACFYLSLHAKRGAQTQGYG